MRSHHPGRTNGRDDVDMPAGTELVVVTGQTAGAPRWRGGSRAAGGSRPRPARRSTSGLRPGSSWTVRVKSTVPSTVDVDPAALVGQRRWSRRCACLLGDVGAEHRIVVPVRPVLAAPAVEGPVHGAERAVGLDGEGRTRVAHPRVVERAFQDPDAGRAVESRQRRSAQTRTGDERHRLIAADRRRDIRPCAPGRDQGVRVLWAERVVRRRESHPGTCVRLPLRGHPASGRSGAGLGHAANHRRCGARSHENIGAC